jgi:hypothetical protein
MLWFERYALLALWLYFPLGYAQGNHLVTASSPCTTSICHELGVKMRSWMGLATHALEGTYTSRF